MKVKAGEVKLVGVAGGDMWMVTMVWLVTMNLIW
jgi:hypothetical protein